ncbi:MAG: Zn-ribbon domain-containing OB-fold protein [Planctomycetota bacterium]|nr:Zn-ribbon domain-containing OB-fold protein [Planctomycetota bacterium]
MEITAKHVEKTATALRLKDVMDGKVLSVKWDPNLKYAWDNGPAIARYLAELKNGRIIAKRCDKCHRIMIPPRMFCELCWRPTDEWVFVKDTGIVNTWVISHVDWKAGRLDIAGGVRPFTPAIIEIDGASKGMGILHHLNDVDPKKICRGMKVKAVWLPPEERVGAITDIKYFRPAK